MSMDTSDDEINDPHAHEHEERTAEDMRWRRNAALAASDWTQVADAPVNAAAWAAYRQQLRDLTDDAAWPFVDLPEPPA